VGEGDVSIGPMPGISRFHSPPAENRQGRQYTTCQETVGTAHFLQSAQEWERPSVHSMPGISRIHSQTIKAGGGVSAYMPRISGIHSRSAEHRSGRDRQRTSSMGWQDSLTFCRARRARQRTTCQRTAGITHELQNIREGTVSA